MEIIRQILIVFLLVLFILYLFIDMFKFHEEPEHFVDVPNLNNKNVQWKIHNQCNYTVVQAYRDILDKYKIKQSNDDLWSLYIPCSYNEISDEIAIANKNIKNNQLSDTDKRIFVLNNCDEITAKDSVWANLLQYYGRDEAIKMMPTTYILNNNDDIELFKKEYNTNKIYIMKKNIQRQEGLLITKDQDTILNGNKNGYVIVQELLQDPYTINGRKINMRIYLLMICMNGKIGAYVYNNGFMYYTKTNFEKGSTNTDSNITTGYIDRQVYKENPLTLQDFKEYLDSNRVISFNELNIISDNYNHNNSIGEYVFNSIHNLIRKMVIALEQKICNKADLRDNVQFQIFGVDVSLSDQLIPHIMEVNKGPDLGYKDDRDKEVKLGVVEDAFKILKIVDDNSGGNGVNGYIEIY